MFEADKPRKTHECPLKITAWFRCISYWNSPWLFRGSAVSFRHGLSFAIIFHIFCVRIHQEFSFASGSHESQRAPSPPKNDVKWFRVSSKTTSRKVTVDQAISWSVNPHWSAKKHAVFLVPKSGSPVFRKRSFFSPMIYQGILSNIQPVDVGLGGLQGPLTPLRKIRPYDNGL